MHAKRSLELTMNSTQAHIEAHLEAISHFHPSNTLCLNAEGAHMNTPAHTPAESQQNSVMHCANNIADPIHIEFTNSMAFSEHIKFKTQMITHAETPIPK